MLGAVIDDVNHELPQGSLECLAVCVGVADCALDGLVVKGGEEGAGLLFFLVPACADGDVCGKVGGIEHSGG